MHFYTSANKKYLAKARVLAKSVHQYCENATFTLVLPDIPDDDFDLSKEPFDEMLTIEDLDLPIDNLPLWIFQHNPVELCTAVKGQALVHFLEHDMKKVVYLDPDIAVFDDLTDLEKLLDQYDVILTPHQCAPEKTRENVINNEISSLQHGTYNYGFYAVKNSENGLKYARWWRDRLLEFCYDDIPGGIFTDQKWGDLVPALFDNVLVLRKPGYNVSTWNLSNRLVEKTKDGSGYTVNGEPLQFYHFSGFDSGQQIQQLERYANGNAVLYELREWYIRRQYEENQQKCLEAKCYYNFYDNGETVTNHQRRLLYERADLREFFKETNPYHVDQEKSFFLWYQREVLTGNERDARIEELEQEMKELEQELEKSNNNASELKKNMMLMKEQQASMERESFQLKQQSEEMRRILEEIFSSRYWKTKEFIKRIIKKN